MTDYDRELLEAAARAAEMRIFGWTTDDNGIAVLELDDGSYWQPLHENQATDCMGDALRLAIAMARKHPGTTFDIGVSLMYDGRGFSSAGLYSRDTPKASVCEPDLGAATRRAIVRAAAAEAQP